MTPSWWATPDVAEAPDIDALLFAPIEVPVQQVQPTALIDALPCGLFLDEEPRLTLFEDPAWWEPPSATIVPAWHTDKRGVIVEYDQIPRRWDRPIDYGAYVYPVPTFPGTRITMITLEHQLGDPKVVHVGTLFGKTVVTLHAVREGGERAHYLLIFGHLDRVADGLEPGRPLRAGELVGFVGDSESPGLVHLHLEARRVRDGVDPATLKGVRVLARDATVVSDPRNVLPLEPLTRPSSCKERRRAEHRAALFDDLRLTLDP